MTHSGVIWLNVPEFEFIIRTFLVGDFDCPQLFRPAQDRFSNPLEAFSRRVCMEDGARDARGGDPHRRMLPIKSSPRTRVDLGHSLSWVFLVGLDPRRALKLAGSHTPCSVRTA